MTSSILIFLSGIALLFLGAEVLIRGSSRLALSLGIRPLIVGLTIVAMGTSSPELGVSLMAAFQKSRDIALGNILGSNVANIALVVGSAAVLRPLKIQMTTVKREMPFLIIASIVFFLLSLDGVLGHWDGIILLAGFVLFIVYVIRLASKDRELKDRYSASDQPVNTTRGRSLLNLLMAVGGLIILISGSTLMVNSATRVATVLGISELVIGVTMVAIGTSLPELAISTMSTLKGEVDLAVGNAVGSNIFNTLLVIALVAVLFPIEVGSNLLGFHYPFMIVLTLIFLPMMRTGFVLNRWEGATLLIIYVVFIYLLFTPFAG
jgi:cation:H+ antiporter